MDEKNKDKIKNILLKGLDEKTKLRDELKAAENEKKYAEKELWEEKAFTERALDTILDPFYVFDLEGRFLRWNRRMNEVTGYSDDEIAIMEPGALFFEKETQYVAGAIKQTIEDGYARVEVNFVTKDGRHILHEFSLSLLKDQNDTPIGICGVGRDLTIRKQLEEEKLKMSVITKRAEIIDAMGDGLILVNLKGKIESINPAFEKVTGYRRKDMVGKAAMELIPIILRDKDTENIEKDFINVLMGQPSDTEHQTYAITTKKGNVIHASFTTSFLKDAKGEPTLIIVTMKDMTEQVNAEEELLKSKEKFRDLVENINDVLYTMDNNGNITYISPVVTSVMGVVPSEVVGRPFAEIIYPKDLPRCVQGFQKVLNGKSTRGEYRIMTKTGEIRWIRTSNRPIFQGESVIGARGLLTDITDQRKAQEALYEGKERLRRIIDGMMDPVFMTDMEGRIVRFNNAFTESMGWGEECIGNPPTSLVVERDIPRVVESMKEAFEKGFVKNFDCYVLTKDKREIPVLVNTTTLKDHKGRPTGLVAAVRDITDRKRAEEVLRKSEEQFRTLAEASLAGIFIFKDLKFEYVNPSACRILGYNQNELIGKLGPMDITHPSDIARTEDFIKRCFEGQTGLPPLTIRSFTKDGSVVYLEILARRIDSKEEPAIIGTIIDITNRKRAEDKLTETLENLARSNKELEQFAYVASHDLQEPLRKVRSFTELLASRYKGNLDEKADKYITHITDGAERMQLLIQDLLAFSRVETRGKAPELTESKVAFERAVSSLQTAIEESGAIITNDSLPPVYADESQLPQIFQNLIGNAIKFRGKKTPKVHVSTEQRENDVLFAVKDNGIGIDLKYADRVFQIFQRLHTKSDYPGSGIGLAICKKIVERHNGRMWLESKVGKGTTFYFTIPSKSAGNVIT